MELRSHVQLYILQKYHPISSVVGHSRWHTEVVYLQTKTIWDELMLTGFSYT